MKSFRFVAFALIVAIIGGCGLLDEKGKEATNQADRVVADRLATERAEAARSSLSTSTDADISISGDVTISVADLSTVSFGWVSWPAVSTFGINGVFEVALDGVALGRNELHATASADITTSGQHRLSITLISLDSGNNYGLGYECFSLQLGGGVLPYEKTSVLDPVSGDCCIDAADNRLWGCPDPGESRFFEIDVSASSSRSSAGTVHGSAYTTVNLTGANVTLCQPTPAGITALNGAPTAQTISSRGYTINTKRSVATVTSGQPLFVCASDQAGTLTLLSLIPPDTVADSTTLRVSVTPESTLIGLMLCPGGTYPPTRGPCYTVNATDLDSLDGAIARFTATQTDQALSFDTLGDTLDNALRDPDVQSTLSHVAGGYGHEATTPSQTTGAPSLPIVQSDGAQEGEASGEILPGSPDVAPSATPETQTIAGSWSGSYTVTSPAGCNGWSGWWRATFSLTDGVVSGSFTSEDGIGGSISGSQTGSTVAWVVGNGGVSYSGAVTGNSVSGSFWNGPDCFLGGGGATGGTFSGNRQ